MKGPCKSCEKREVNCHSRCSEFLKYRKRLDKINQIKREEMNFISYSFDRKLKMGVGRLI